MEIERLTIKNGEIGFYGDIYNKCSNKNDPKIRKQIESGKQYCDIKGFKYHQYSHKELSGIYKKLSLFEDIMEKHLIETPEMLDVRLSENSNVNKMFATKIADLEAKLAEKDAEIEGLKKEIRDELIDNNMAILELQQSQNQTAIAELEKVRNNVGDYFEVRNLKWTDKLLVGKVCNLINEILDQQIKSLKGEK